MASQAEKIAHHFLDILNNSTGLKVTELVVKVTMGIHEDTEFTPKPSSDEIIESVNLLIQVGKIIEIDYTVPNIDWRLKSFLLPKDSKIVSISGQPQTLEINEENFQVLSHWASTTRTINQTIRLFTNVIIGWQNSVDYAKEDRTGAIHSKIDEMEANISELEALRPIFENLNQKAKDIAFLKNHREKYEPGNVEQAIGRSKRETPDSTPSKE